MIIDFSPDAANILVELADKVILYGLLGCFSVVGAVACFGVFLFLRGR